jgi:hypothetical protein
MAPASTFPRGYSFERKAAAWPQHSRSDPRLPIFSKSLECVPPCGRLVRRRPCLRHAWKTTRARAGACLPLPLIRCGYSCERLRHGRSSPGRPRAVSSEFLECGGLATALVCGGHAFNTRLRVFSTSDVLVSNDERCQNKGSRGFAMAPRTGTPLLSRLHLI